MAATNSTSKRGFASMDGQRQREIASKGGRSVPADKRSFSQDRELASQAGRKGGQASGGTRNAQRWRQENPTLIKGRRKTAFPFEGLLPDTITHVKKNATVRCRHVRKTFTTSKARSGGKAVIGRPYGDHAKNRAALEKVWNLVAVPAL
jgi:general stress protein YciG